MVSNLSHMPVLVAGCEMPGTDKIGACFEGMLMKNQSNQALLLTASTMNKVSTALLSILLALCSLTTRVGWSVCVIQERSFLLVCGIFPTSGSWLLVVSYDLRFLMVNHEGVGFPICCLEAGSMTEKNAVFCSISARQDFRSLHITTINPKTRHRLPEISPAPAGGCKSYHY